MKLTLNELSFLKSIYKDANQLSLFTNIESELIGGEKDSLEKKLVIKDGEITKVWKNILAPVANPGQCTRLILRDGDFLIEKYSYKNDELLTLVENNGDGNLEFTLPDGVKPQLLQLGKWIGMSNLTSMEVDLELTIKEIMVLLALVDLARQSVFGGYLREKSIININRQNLENQLNEPTENSLLSILKINYDLEVPGVEDIDEIIGSLKIKKVLEVSGDEYSLAQDLVVLAIQMLIPQSILLLENLELGAGDELMVSSYMALSAGVKDILLFAFEGGKVRLMSMTSMQLMKLIEDLLLFNKGDN
jgi:hypothetical protein